jgi:hypothetical protein
MKRTEETLKKLIKIETRSVSREMLNEMACRILTQVCKSALVQATVTDTELVQPEKEQGSLEARAAAVNNLREYAGKKARSQIKIGPSTYLSDPLLLDIKEMIDEELSVLYPKPTEKSKSK